MNAVHLCIDVQNREVDFFTENNGVGPTGTLLENIEQTIKTLERRGVPTIYVAFTSAGQASVGRFHVLNKKLPRDERVENLVVGDATMMVKTRASIALSPTLVRHPLLQEPDTFFLTGFWEATRPPVFPRSGSCVFGSCVSASAVDLAILGKKAVVIAEGTNQFREPLAERQTIHDIGAQRPKYSRWRVDVAPLVVALGFLSK